MKPSRLAAAAALLCTCALAGCSPSGAASPNAQAGGQAPTSASATTAGAAKTTTAGAANRDCTGGLTADQAGVVRITCDGTATIHVHAGTVDKDFHGGVCHSAGDIWSAAAGVIIDVTGTHGRYTGPPVDSVAINNTASGKATVQLSLSGKQYYDLGTAKLALTAGGKSAHIVGTSHRLSDAPGAKITVDVTC
jgi:hypothetical protein